MSVSGLIILIVWLLIWLSRKQETTPETVAPQRLKSPIMVWLSEDIRWGALLRLFLFPLALTFSWWVASGEWQWLPGVVILLPFLLPGWFARKVAGPLRCPRLAYRMAGQAWWKWRCDMAGGAALEMARTECRRTSHSAHTLLSLEYAAHSGELPSEHQRAAMSREGARFPETRLRGGSLAALALLAEMRGNRDEARRLMEGVLRLPSTVTPPEARRCAREWLVVDAASHSEWERLFDLAAGRPRSTTTTFIALAAQRILGRRDAPSTLRLRIGWLLARRRLSTRPLLAEALRPPFHQPPEKQVIDRSAPPGDRFSVALRFLLEATGPSAGPLPHSRLEELETAWSRVFADPDFERKIFQRALALYAPNGHHILAKLREEVTGVIRESKAARRGDGRPGKGFQLTGGEQPVPSLPELRNALNGLRTRLQTDHLRSTPKEYLDWLTILELYEAFRKSPDDPVRRQMYPFLHQLTTDLGATFFNIRKQHTLAHAMFRWLREESMTMKNHANFELDTRNVRCGF